MPVVPALPDSVNPWQAARVLGFRRGCRRDEAWHTASVPWQGGVGGVMGGVIVPVSAEDGQATRAQAQGSAYRLTLAASGWRWKGRGAAPMPRSPKHDSTWCGHAPAIASRG